MSKLTPEDRVGASQVKSVGRLFFVEGTAQAKAWSADIRRHVPRRPELLEQWGVERWLWGGGQRTGCRGP